MLDDLFVREFREYCQRHPTTLAESKRANKYNFTCEAFTDCLEAFPSSLDPTDDVDSRILVIHSVLYFGMYHMQILEENIGKTVVPIFDGIHFCDIVQSVLSQCMGTDVTFDVSFG